MPVGQGWLQLGELGLSFVLAAAVGLEREYRGKSAGLRTYSLVGVSAALFMLVSKYGFTNVLEAGRVVVDPSRVAAQIVSGIGFIGGGVIFMRRDAVRGLTTAASVWLVAALGMACGAGLPVLGVATTVGYFGIMFVYPRLVRRFLPLRNPAAARLRVGCADDPALLRAIAGACRAAGFAVGHAELERDGAGREAWPDDAAAASPGAGDVTFTLLVSGTGSLAELVLQIGEMPLVSRVASTDADLPD